MTTAEKTRYIMQKAHLLCLRYGVEDAVSRAEEFDMITFSSWEDCDLNDVISEDSARSTFIDYVIDYIVLSEDLYDNNPNGYTDSSFDAYVLDCATDLNFRKE